MRILPLTAILLALATAAPLAVQVNQAGFAARGLLLLGARVLWLVTRRRRRPAYPGW